ncbi:type II toxin-antitoxin system ParD family antitoxin [uncultured Aquimarina sp.]|uniref:type II toxin-antitoxin system ParD family antitoxin n=1 Tax=uncultured Aquimarina sp. TaxID=575652 RepID=UPI002637D530|nr:type II toxin-antitoxin system ParD family antitoxin [uncultured Aquimarina sp.]
MNISLTEELVDVVQGKVDSGKYNSASEVIREALRHMENNEELVDFIKLQALKKRLAPGIHNGENGTYAEYSLENQISELDEKMQ